MLQKSTIQGLRALLKHNIFHDSKPGWWPAALWQHRALCRCKKILPWIFHQKKRTHSKWKKIKPLPKSRNNGRGNEMTTREVQIFQPLPDSSNKTHRIQIFRVGKKTIWRQSTIHLIWSAWNLLARIEIPQLRVMKRCISCWFFLPWINFFSWHHLM